MASKISSLSVWESNHTLVLWPAQCTQRLQALACHSTATHAWQLVSCASPADMVRSLRAPSPTPSCSGPPTRLLPLVCACACLNLTSWTVVDLMQCTCLTAACGGSDCTQHRPSSAVRPLTPSHVGSLAPCLCMLAGIVAWMIDF